MDLIDPELVKELIKDSPWVGLCWYMMYNHFKLHGRTVEVMTAIKTLIENLDCMKGNVHDIDNDNSK